MSPATIGRYRVVGELGRGGMGVVYRAHDPVVDRTVAIKTIQAGDTGSSTSFEQVRLRFLQEARAAGRLNHPNIVSVLDAGTDEATGVSFITMELVSGRDLEAQMRAGVRLSPQGAAELVATVADALTHAHERGIVHRDVKPANILQDASGQVKVTDFGIAGVADSGLTRTGQVLGSPAYMSPEQISGQRVDARSDIFSLGVVLYELLAGTRPFPGESVSTLTYQIVHSDPVPLCTVNPAVTPALEAIVARALAKRPDDRFPTAAELSMRLRQEAMTASVPLAASPTGTLIDAPSFAQTQTSVAMPPVATTRSRRGVWLAAAIAALLVAAIAAVWMRRPPVAAVRPPSSPAPQRSSAPARQPARRPTAAPSVAPQPRDHENAKQEAQKVRERQRKQEEQRRDREKRKPQKRKHPKGRT